MKVRVNEIDLTGERAKTLPFDSKDFESAMNTIFNVSPSDEIAEINFVVNKGIQVRLQAKREFVEVQK